MAKSASLLAALLLSGLQPGCGTSPTNPDGCRSIEEARCRAAPACPDYKHLDVESCVRFYRDQCLHGMAISEDPGQPNIDRCVAAIQAAGKCAAAGQNKCDVGPVSKGAGAVDPCEFIAHPENVAECSFLVPPEPPAQQPDAASNGSDKDAAAQKDAQPDAPKKTSGN